MITSKQIITLIERYDNTFNINGREIVIFVNPTKDNLKVSKAKKLRFIADCNKKEVYVWNSYFAIHNSVVGRLGYHSQFEKNLFCGGADIANNTTYITNSDYLEDVIRNSNMKIYYDSTALESLKYKFSKDWTWLDKYIIGSSYYISKIKERFLKKMAKVTK